jgi:hypothetical protein
MATTRTPLRLVVVVQILLPHRPVALVGLMVISTNTADMEAMGRMEDMEAKVTAAVGTIATRCLQFRLMR